MFKLSFAAVCEAAFIETLKFVVKFLLSLFRRVDFEYSLVLNWASDGNLARDRVSIR